MKPSANTQKQEYCFTSDELVTDSLVTGESFESSNWASFQEPLLFPTDTMEYLIYDFSELEIGDTITYNNSLNPEYFNVIIETDSVLVEDFYRKVYEVSDPNDWQGQTSYLIEGIGSSKGLLAPFKFLNQTSFNRYQLLCFTHGSILFQNPYEEEVINCQVGVSVNELSKVEFSIYPNPAQNTLQINSQQPFSKLTVYNTIGKQVQSENLENKNSIELDISNLPSGTYYIQISGSGFSLIKRFIKI